MPEQYPTSIRIDKALRAALIKRASAQGASLNWLICDILKKWEAWTKGQEKK